MDRKDKLRVLGKLLDSGFDSEKRVIEFGIRDMMVTGIRNDEIGILLELQEAAKNHKVISFLADEKKKAEISGGTEND